jgi:hypothetical protein
LCQNIGSRFSFLDGNKNNVEQNRKNFIYNEAESEINEEVQESVFNNGNGKYHKSIYGFNPSFQKQGAKKQSQPFKRNSYNRK